MLLTFFLLIDVANAGNRHHAEGTEETIKEPNEKPKRDENAVFQGFSGGMMLHVGYGFAKDSKQLYNMAGELPLGGVTYGVGGELRIHLLKHLRVGGEGYVSNMPLLKNGTNVRMGYGGALVDCYDKWGKFWPFIGTSIGGGVVKRMYVLAKADGAEVETPNAAFTTNDFFMINPFVGGEIELSRAIHLLLKVDYLLPFGVNRWNVSLLYPSGPKFHVGIMFTH